MKAIIIITTLLVSVCVKSPGVGVLQKLLSYRYSRTGEVLYCTVSFTKFVRNDDQCHRHKNDLL